MGDNTTALDAQCAQTSGNLTIVTTCHVTGIVMNAIDVNSQESGGSHWRCQAFIILCSLATTRELCKANLCHKQLQGPQSLFLTGSVIRIGVNGSQNISVLIQNCRKCNKLRKILPIYFFRDDFFKYNNISYQCSFSWKYGKRSLYIGVAFVPWFKHKYCSYATETSSINLVQLSQSVRGE